MIRSLLAALGGVLAGASLALGQAQSVTPPLPLLGSSASVAEMTPPAPADHGLCDEGVCCPGREYLSFEAESVLWVRGPRRQGFPVGATGPIGTLSNVSAGTPLGQVVNFLIGQAPAGALTTNVTSTLGDDNLDRKLTPGGRFSIGYWLTEPNPSTPGCEIPCLGAEARFFFVSRRSFDYTDTAPTLVRPFLDVSTGNQSAVVVAIPGLATGSLTVHATNSLWGAEANMWKRLYAETPDTLCSVEGMVGLRYLDRDETASVGRDSLFTTNPAAFTPTAFPAFAFLSGNSIVEQESFTTRNRFYGGQVGARGHLYFDKLVVTGQFDLALGITDEEITITGSQTRTTPAGVTIVSPGALLALPGNIGRFSKAKFTQVPDVNITFAYPVADYLTVSLGLTALYWSRIVRVSDQVPLQINSNTIPSFPGATGMPAAREAGVPFNQSDLWLLGLFLSAELRW